MVLLVNWKYVFFNLGIVFFFLLFYRGLEEKEDVFGFIDFVIKFLYN